MSVASRRLRFEILKRDGFRCRYCGATAVESLLHVDHVVPEASGGTDDPTNLVSSCASCNLGKSDVGLGESRLPSAPSAADLSEQAMQIRDYLYAAEEVELARAATRDWLAQQWRERVGEDPLVYLCEKFRHLAMQYPLETLVDAMAAVGDADHVRAPMARVKYFYGVLRRRREREAGMAV